MEVYRILKSTSWYLLCFCFKFNLVSSEDYCYTKDNNSYANFGTKTAYKHIYGKDVYIIPGIILLLTRIAIIITYNNMINSCMTK